MHIIEAKQIHKNYAIENREMRILSDVSLNVIEGETLVITGSSGSGKTTLLSLLAGLDKPTGGHIFMQGQDITHMHEDELAPLRNQTIGFVFQSFHLVPSLTAIENITFPAEICKDRLAGQKAQTLLERVGLLGRKANYPHQLSGGEKQRVAICRALINAPRILFADEPTGNLDSENGQTILRLLLDLKTEHQATLILATHSNKIAAMADRIIMLKDGQLFEERQHVG